MHPLMIQELAEVRLSEARDHAARLWLARAARHARLAGTIRRERRLHRWQSILVSLLALRDPRAT